MLLFGAGALLLGAGVFFLGSTQQRRSRGRSLLKAGLSVFPALPVFPIVRRGVVYAARLTVERPQAPKPRVRRVVP